MIATLINSVDVDLELKGGAENDFNIHSYHANKDDGRINLFNSNFVNKVKAIDGVKNVEDVIN
ncbi:hypothetical protein BD780_003613 [Clostridium tetanomorphum]|uniref:Uncharacterized protein n=1 Tax=Clostridium tetanomorphum TaxID=1553 RepID=A0A923EBV2_CLOTT|nr:hypothetical protein [Clostridium tetanomorphum]KAJ49937.1 hypothetical protein CTM_20535 [Clostridium tetanomorphum DSM 665]MBC2400200.1 hypothetical protein [Clostridium tetanomorphum]MBP1866616.1 hypothetical protein [Clostridium tetanomorphum]NRS86388.1 hypothetical protein [Clostridium tetanomorphum]NRZ95583.1 hypothetical protein [Clostridium tetanomorphum]